MTYLQRVIDYVVDSGQPPLNIANIEEMIEKILAEHRREDMVAVARVELRQLLLYATRGAILEREYEKVRDRLSLYEKIPSGVLESREVIIRSEDDTLDITLPKQKETPSFPSKKEDTRYMKFPHRKAKKEV